MYKEALCFAMRDIITRNVTGKKQSYPQETGLLVGNKDLTAMKAEWDKGFGESARLWG